jgi:hypothetical protein
VTKTTNTRRSDAEFAALPKAEQRVALATDALAWLEAGGLVAKTGLYVHPVDISVHVSRAMWKAQARDTVIGPCNVCGLGALLISKIVRSDGCTVGELLVRPGSLAYEKLEEHFSFGQLANIDTAFERHWTKRYPDPKSRLAAILENIIRNGGTFVAEEVTP